MLIDDKLTNKDAITVLRNLQDWLYLSGINGGTSIQREAIDIAIKALEAEPHWIPVTKEEMFKAGYDGREIIFKVDGRLFAIRELAQ